MNRVAVDIGGTFTDIVVEDIKNKYSITYKVLSSPKNPAFAVIDGLKHNIIDFKNISFLVHGQTVGLNSFLERKGARVLLIMTSGISDTYTIARGDRKKLYDLQYQKPKQLVPRMDVHEIRERISVEGKIIEKLNEKDFNSIIKKIKSENIQSIAICFLHSYVNPKHEIQAKKILEKKINRKNNYFLISRNCQRVERI